MKNVLLFNFKNGFGGDIILTSDNHLDLQHYLETELGFGSITFQDLEREYGKCHFKQREWEEVESAECYYIKKI